jgi:hypothetical protein
MIRHVRSVQRIGCTVMVGILAAIVGCGEADGRLPLSGVVTWQGRPLQRGSIVFVPASGHRGPKVGAEIVAGQYQIAKERGPTAGTYRVEVRSDSGERPHSPTDSRPRTAPVAQPVSISSEFNSQSRLTVAISADRTELDFALPTKVP